VRATIRVDATPAIGHGHMARCVTLARALREHGVTSAFAMRGPGGAATAWLAREGIPVLEIDGDELNASRRAAEGAALVIVDGYAFDASWHEALRAPSRCVCVVDDLATAPLGGDAVLNGNVFAPRLSYDLPPGAVRLIGSSYALVRDEFLEARERRLTSAGQQAGRKAQVLVTMGGADPAEGTELVLEAIGQSEEPMHLRVVVGGSNPRVEAIRAAAARLSDHVVEVIVDSRDMAGEMLWCDVAVTAAGSTCLELACVGVPALTLVLGDNQAPVAAELARRGLMPTAGRVGELSAGEVRDALAALLGDPAKRAVEAAQRELVDGNGARRAAEALVAAARRAGHAVSDRMPADPEL
jgi:UDP-2,4-diacetamido-2,4,6-trideoxy-beta-L-altropyranose hydrolase